MSVKGPPCCKWVTEAVADSLRPALKIGWRVESVGLSRAVGRSRTLTGNVPQAARGCRMSKAPAPPRRITIVDVALLANVSTTTVSKVLRNAYGASPTARAKVRQAIDELGYRP